MIQKLLASAVFAGVAAGLVAALLQFAFVVPLLLEGELYESGARVHFVENGTPQSERGAPGLGGDLGRHAMTVAFDVVTYTGFALILVALMALAERRGITVTPKQGIIWGLAGFVAVQLAPAIGLPPELPGTPAAELGPRQAWWAATIFLTAGGIALLAFGQGVAAAIAGVALILAPHLIGAPHLDTYWGIAPPELSAEFATVSLGVAAAGWTLLGFLCAWFWTRFRDG
ncbi:MAG: hypothetical protein D6811_02845 [Alphaproteobacteria bacterium]|nr:MAG: hypothetical protein D6811_02845 [Alphaproteobacteria bacterium]